MKKVLVFNANGKPFRVPLSRSEITIGRGHNNQIVIPDDRVSEQHMKLIILDNNELVIKDLNSMNGTFVNGRKIQEVQVRLDDQIRIGGCMIENLRVEAAVGSAPAKKTSAPVSMQKQVPEKRVDAAGTGRTKWIIGLAAILIVLVLAIALITVAVKNTKAKERLMQVHDQVTAFISAHPELAENLSSYPHRTAAIQNKFALLEQYRGDYNKIHNAYTNLTGNVLLKAGLSLMAPGIKTGLDTAFAGIDKLYAAGGKINTVTQTAPELSLTIKNYGCTADKEKLKTLRCECFTYQSATTEFLSGFTETKNTVTSIRENVQGFMKSIDSLAGNSVFVEMFYFFDDFIQVLSGFEKEIDGFIQPYEIDMQTVQQLSDLIPEKL